ncbi:hypothetical protein [Acrocarpospora pleiomorpha]|uniref:hypothetical protein n=1 Tax=Acrocarpospora pleiomorpha TaxID=90975 RepID=UPI0012D2DD07|nr:hypothetical protein [Acrocarpospora pleiomorpha]
MQALATLALGRLQGGSSGGRGLAALAVGLVGGPSGGVGVARPGVLAGGLRLRAVRWTTALRPRGGATFLIT